MSQNSRSIESRPRFQPKILTVRACSVLCAVSARWGLNGLCLDKLGEKLLFLLATTRIHSRSLYEESERGQPGKGGLPLLPQKAKDLCTWLGKLDKPLNPFMRRPSCLFNQKAIHLSFLSMGRASERAPDRCLSLSVESLVDVTDEDGRKEHLGERHASV